MKSKRILLLAFAAAMLFSMLFNPPLAGAQSQTTGNFSPDASLQQMGFNNTQPSRKDPDGNPIDTKTQNPLGSPKKTIASSKSLAAAGLKGDYFEMYDVTPSGAEVLMKGGLTYVYNSIGRPYSWRSLPKVMTAANLNETTVYQQVLIAVLVPDPYETKYELLLVIEDYNAGQPKSYAIPLNIKGITMPGLTRTAIPYVDRTKKISFGDPDPETFQAQDYKSHFKMVACQGRVAILVNQTLYDFALNYSKSSGYTVTQKKSVTFDNYSTVAPIASGDTPVIDLEAGDVNNDGLQDLAVTVGSAQGTKDTRLLLYRWEQDQAATFNQPMYSASVSAVTLTAADLKKPGGPKTGTLKHAAVAVGNVTGKGTSVLVSGYNEKNVFTFTYFTYDPKTGKFAATQIPMTGNGMPALRKDNWYDDPNPKYNVVPVLTCVSFSATLGMPQYIFYDGWIFQYDQSARNFTLIREHYRSGSDTDIIFFDTAAYTPSMDVLSQPGAEMLAVLTQNSKYGNLDSVRYYAVQKGGISSPGSDFTSSRYPALCGAAVKGSVKTLKYVSYAFAMSDPKVIAVLGASPAYQELKEAYPYWGNQTTTFGTSTSKEEETSHGLSVRGGLSAGLSVEESIGVIFNTTISSFEAVFSITGELSWEWSKSTSVSTSQSFTAVDKDMVVLTSTPRDLYTYEIINPGQPDHGSKIIITIPYQPQLSMMNLEDYNNLVDQINKAAGKTVATPVPSSVLKHIAGDPRTYPSDIESFNCIVPRSVVMRAGDFTGVGSGSGLSEESITLEESSSKSFSVGVDFDLEVQVTVGFVLAGYHLGAGYQHTSATTIGSGTEFSGSVLNLPPNKFGQYNFNWKLVGYKAYLTPDKSDQCYVVNYLVKPSGNIPPHAPSNLQLISYTADAAGTSATIGWDSVNNANKYLIYRSTSPDVDTAKEPHAEVYPQAGAGNRTKLLLFVDDSLDRGQQYYYAVVAEKQPGVVSAPSDPLAVPELIKSFAIKTQPVLDYHVGEVLDLSALVITATLEDKTTTDLTFDDLLQRGMSFSLADGTVLSAKNNGVSIYITDPMTGYYVVTKPLKVSSVSLALLNITTNFTVGGINNASSLAPNKALTAHISVANKQSTPQAVIAVVALFDPDGAMTNVEYSSRTIAAGATAEFNVGGFMLPSSVTGYVAKAFVLEGTQFSTSSLRPLSSIAQISS